MAVPERVEKLKAQLCGLIDQQVSRLTVKAEWSDYDVHQLRMLAELVLEAEEKFPTQRA